MNKLKPCPKCGVPPKIGYCCGEYLIYGEDPSCPFCGEAFAVMHTNKKLEIEAWNGRVEIAKKINYLLEWKLITPNEARAILHLPQA